MTTPSAENSVPIVGIGGPVRFLSRGVFAFSASGRYFAAKPTFARDPICSLVVNAETGSVLTALPANTSFGVWATNADRLFLAAPDGVQSWEPGRGFSKVAADEWLDPQPAPGGRVIAYTRYAKPEASEIRVGIFDLAAGRPVAGLPDKPRSQAFRIADGGLVPGRGPLPVVGPLLSCNAANWQSPGLRFRRPD